MTLEELERKQRQLIVHSFMYYVFDESVWSDNKYDGLALQIEEQKGLDIWKKSKFSSIFIDWDSSTGMNLIKKNEKKYVKYYTHFYCLAKQLLAQ